MSKIQPAATEHPAAVLADRIEIGVYSVVEAEVLIGAGSVPNVAAPEGSGTCQFRGGPKSYVKA
jgi:acyl-[acyl carrier protein]--UDP-N-acetylglucosamine O-acyltransferase